MDFRQVALGIVLFLIFWGFQAGYLDFLGNIAWFVGALVISLLPWAFEMGRRGPKPPEQVKQLWMFASAFVIVSVFIASFLAPSLGLDVSTPKILSIFLIIFGGGWLLHGWFQKQGIPALIGIIWIFSTLHFVASPNDPNSYIYFALVVGISFVLNGVFTKKSR